MNAELPPFKIGEHNSENASTINRVITPLKNQAPEEQAMNHRAIEKELVLRNSWRIE